MNYTMMNIPRHTNCKNCGKCCGIIPATAEETKVIRNYITKNDIKPIIRADKSICPFRDSQAKKCMIYPVRPLICRLYGVADTDVIKCPHGNSASIDGLSLLAEAGARASDMQILNFTDWETRE